MISYASRSAVAAVIISLLGIVGIMFFGSICFCVYRLLRDRYKNSAVSNTVSNAENLNKKGAVHCEDGNNENMFHDCIDSVSYREQLGQLRIHVDNFRSMGQNSGLLSDASEKLSEFLIEIRSFNPEAPRVTGEKVCTSVEVLPKQEDVAVFLSDSKQKVVNITEDYVKSAIRKADNYAKEHSNGKVKTELLVYMRVVKACDEYNTLKNESQASVIDIMKSCMEIHAAVSGLNVASGVYDNQVVGVVGASSSLHGSYRSSVDPIS